VELSTSFLSNRLLLGQDTTASTADLTARLGLFALPDAYYARYRADLLAVTPTEIEVAASRLFNRAQAIVVVAGDAEKLERPLSRFGQVHTLIPEDDFRVDRVVTQDPSAPL
jgi:predicted Zn-dependent peptidase